MATPTIALIGTLDTKGVELQYVRERVAALGGRAILIDSGILGEPGCRADVPRDEVARRAGHTLQEIRDAGSRGAAVELMQVGVAAVCRDLQQRGVISGALCFGGAEGALMGAAAMHALPLGFPKVIVSPSASGRRAFGPFMGRGDVVVMHSVIDILGLNPVARCIYDNAVAAVLGMVREGGGVPAVAKASVGVTMLGQTTPGVMAMSPVLEQAGLEPIIFHANGVGGPAMEDLIGRGVLRGVIDFSLSEVANSMFDGIHATEQPRLLVAARAGVPQVVVPGCADFFNQGPLDDVPEIYRDRILYPHNPVATLVRINPPEMRELGRIVAERVNRSTGPVAVLAPTGGFSVIGIAGGPLHDHEGDLALIDALEAALRDDIPFTRVDAAINDPAFARLVGEHYVALAGAVTPTDGTGTVVKT